MKTIIKQAERFDRVIILKYDTGDYVDITGCLAFSQMRNKPGGELVATAECSITPLLGRVSVSFSSDVTAAIPVGDYGFDVWLVENEDKKPIHTELVQVVKRYTDNFEQEEG